MLLPNVVCPDGRTFGTLYCFSQARTLDLAESKGVRDPVPNWSLEPMETYESKVWRLPRRGVSHWRNRAATAGESSRSKWLVPATTRRWAGGTDTSRRGSRCSPKALARGTRPSPRSRA